MGTSAIENKELVKSLSTKFPRRIIVGIDAKEGKVSTRGWLQQSDVLATELVKEFSSFKIDSFIVTDINTDGTLEGTNEVFIKKILEITDIPVIASGGVGSISDLLSLTKFEHSGLYGVIVGKALYENKFTISEANNILSTERIIIGIDAKDGKVSTRGWLKQSDVLATDLVKEFSYFKIASFIITDINTCLLYTSDAADE